MLAKWYNEKILDYFLNPRQVGKFEELNNLSQISSGRAGSKSQGEIMILQIKISKINQQKIISDTRQLTYGCGCAIAANSWLAEKIIGLNLYQAQEISDKIIIDALKLVPQKHHCGLLAEQSLKLAIKNYISKYGE